MLEAVVALVLAAILFVCLIVLINTAAIVVGVWASVSAVNFVMSVVVLMG